MLKITNSDCFLSEAKLKFKVEIAMLDCIEIVSKLLKPIFKKISP